MPLMVKIKPNPDYKPSPATKKAFEDVKAAGTKTAAWVTAIEAIRNSDGMYVMEQEEAAPAAEPRSLDDMPIEELKVMMLSLGVKTEKQMKRSDIVRLIRLKLDEVEVIEDE